MPLSVERTVNYLGVTLNGKKKEDNIARAEKVLAPVFYGAWIGALFGLYSGDMYYTNVFTLIEAGLFGELTRQAVITWKRKANEQKIRS